MKKRIKLKGFIAVLIIVASLLHYFGGVRESPVHTFFRLLYYIPIILAAFNFGFKGGVIASLAISLIYSPFILLTLHTFNAQILNEFFDIVLFFAVGIITGTLVEKKNMSLAKFDEELKRYMLLENYTNSIIESIKGGVVAVNSDMLITSANQGAKDMLAAGSDCIGQNFTEVFACCESVKDTIYRAFIENKPFENIEVMINRNNLEKAVRINVYPLNFENVKKGLVIIIDDITEVKKLQKELLRNEKLAALGELSTGVAHEIRNPLGIIKAIEQTMKSELKDNPEAVKELDIIDEEVERANRVVKALMEFGKPPKGEKALYSIHSVIEDVLTIANKYIMQHGVKVIYNKSDNTDTVMDKELLKQAFVNIIFNAVQAMPGGGRLTISSVNLRDVFITVLFEDTGIGIEEENIDKIFNPFYTTKEDGTGLGLSIVHKIMEEHGGVIRVSSKAGEGTVFEVTLPVRRDLK
jgi:two-component system, sporulation sensor kinase E